MIFYLIEQWFFEKIREHKQKLFFRKNKDLYINPEFLIPEGHYCYRAYRRGVGVNGEFFLRVNTCVFWSRSCGEDLCLYDGGDCFNDQCKTCAINEDWELKNES